MTSLYYITTMANRLADDCEAFEMPIGRPGVETILEALITVNALKRLNLSLIKLAETVKNAGTE